MTTRKHVNITADSAKQPLNKIRRLTAPFNELPIPELSISQRDERAIAVLIVLAFAVLAVGFSLGPIFEGPGEILHYDYVRIIAQTGSLPDPYSRNPGEKHQAPLYYMAASPIILAADISDFAQVGSRHNPFNGYAIRIADNDNKNIRYHPADESFPYTASGTARTAHLIRLQSVLYGIGTLIASYAIFRELWPQRPDRRLLALGFVAFLPQFIYMFGVINNDSLLFLLATVSFWLLLRQQREGPSWRLSILLGLTLGGALLTKASASFLIFPVGLAIVLDRRTWRYAPIILAATSAVSAWWYIRNWILYGDPTLVNVLFEVQPLAPIRGGKLALDIGLQRAPHAYQTFWARFGDGRVPVGPQLYNFFDALTLSVVVGLAIWLARTIVAYRRATPRDAIAVRQGAVVGVFGITWMAALLYFASRDWNGIQGRYLFPGIAAWGAVLAAGLDGWTPRRLRVPFALGGILVLGIIAFITLFSFFLPAFTPEKLPQTIEQPLSLRFDDTAELIGMSPASPSARPEDIVQITLYWRALEQTDANLLVYLHSTDGSVVRRDSLPGTGNLPSTDWQAGQTWAETYNVKIPADARPQATYELVAGLFNQEADAALTATNIDGDEVTPIIGRIAINGEAQPFEPAYRFGDVIGMAAPDITRNSGQLDVCLRWVALASTSTDYHIFVHALDSDGQLVTQLDFEPKQANYPTSAWATGEAISECVMLDATEIPTSGWQLNIGLYDFASGQRLLAQNAEGQPFAENFVVIAP